jgi:hypothetical protein
MAKKKAAAKKAPSAKKGTKTGKKKAAPKREEIVLEPIEQEAIEVARNSEAVCHELEMAVTAALTTAVQKVFKANKVALNSAQAEKVAYLLFGD